MTSHSMPVSSYAERVAQIICNGLYPESAAQGKTLADFPQATRENLLAIAEAVMIDGPTTSNPAVALAEVEEIAEIVERLADDEASDNAPKTALAQALEAQLRRLRAKVRAADEVEYVLNCMAEGDNTGCGSKTDLGRDLEREVQRLYDQIEKRTEHPALEYAWWVSSSPVLDDLAPAQLLAGQPLDTSTGAPIQVEAHQAAHLEKPWRARLSMLIYALQWADPSKVMA